VGKIMWRKTIKNDNITWRERSKYIILHKQLGSWWLDCGLITDLNHLSSFGPFKTKEMALKNLWKAKEEYYFGVD